MGGASGPSRPHRNPALSPQICVRPGAHGHGSAVPAQASGGPRADTAGPGGHTGPSAHPAGVDGRMAAGPDGAGRLHFQW